MICSSCGSNELEDLGYLDTKSGGTIGFSMYPEEENFASEDEFYEHHYLEFKVLRCLKCNSLDLFASDLEKKITTLHQTLELRHDEVEKIDSSDVCGNDLSPQNSTTP